MTTETKVAHVHNPTSPCSCTVQHSGLVESIVYCPTHAAAPEMALALDATARLWHYDHAAIPGSPCYNVPFSRCDGLQCATNRALLRRIK